MPPEADSNRLDLRWSFTLLADAAGIIALIGSGLRLIALALCLATVVGGIVVASESPSGRRRVVAAVAASLALICAAILYAAQLAPNLGPNVSVPRPSSTATTTPKDTTSPPTETAATTESATSIPETRVSASTTGTTATSAEPGLTVPVTRLPTTPQNGLLLPPAGSGSGAAQVRPTLEAIGNLTCGQTTCGYLDLQVINASSATFTIDPRLGPKIQFQDNSGSTLADPFHDNTAPASCSATWASLITAPGQTAHFRICFRSSFRGGRQPRTLTITSTDEINYTVSGLEMSLSS